MLFEYIDVEVFIMWNEEDERNNANQDDYRIQIDENTKTAGKKYADNVLAIRTLKRIEKENQ